MSTGTRGLMIPVRNHEALKKMHVTGSEYLNFRSRVDFFSAHLFCLGGATSNGVTFARHPGSTPAIGEDAFTGSSTGAMAAYLWKNGLLESPVFVAEQGHWMGRPGEARVEIIGPRENIDLVKVGGSAVTLARGEFNLETL